jgi:hypothetical protein
MTMTELLDELMLFTAASANPDTVRGGRHMDNARAVRREIERRLKEAIEVGGSEVRYALEGES